MSIQAGGITVILNNTSIFRQQIVAPITYEVLDQHVLTILGQMSADSQTPFAFAIYASTAANSVNFNFTLSSSPSRGAPAPGAGNTLLHFGWSAFSTTNSLPFTLNIPIPPALLPGPLGIYIAAQNLIAPSVAGYLGLSANVLCGVVGVTGLCHPLLPHSVAGVTSTGRLFGESTLVDPLTLAPLRLPASGNMPVQGTVSSVITNAAGTDTAGVSAGKLGVASSGGGTATSVYLTDVSGAIPVQVTRAGSLVTASGK